MTKKKITVFVAMGDMDIERSTEIEILNGKEIKKLLEDPEKAARVIDAYNKSVIRAAQSSVRSSLLKDYRRGLIP